MTYLISGNDGSKTYERKQSSLAKANKEAHGMMSALEPHSMAKVIIFRDDIAMGMWVGGEAKRWAKAII